jgi:hypothetical protein
VTLFTTNYDDNPDITDPDSLLFRIGARMRSRLHEMCEGLYLSGADYRELPPNGASKDDLVPVEDAAKTMRRPPVPAARRAGARAAARARRPGRPEVVGGRAGS